MIINLGLLFTLPNEIHAIEKKVRNGKLSSCTMFENFSNKSHFSTIFALLKMTCLVTLFDSKFQLFKNFQNEPYLAFLMNFCPLVNVARFARDIE